ncbi:hypothetical protein O6H91_23G028600 [Diphasiastrum complanatum]|nr:hypothetical protein O6H91_23G028600 [Diphasiastrum complanatum]
MIHRVVDPGDIDHKFGMHEENKLVVRPVTIADTRDVHAVEGDAEDFSLEIRNECTMRSGSKDSEKLLQLDVSSHWVRPPQLQVRGANSLHQDTESRSGIGWIKEDLGPDELSRYVEALELKESYVDTVLDMEDVLLNFDDSDGSYYHMVSKGSSLVHPPHDPDNLNAPIFAGNKHQGSLSNSLKVDAIEVIGARQKSGGTSISERVVGVKEHTVYNIKVRAAAKEWEVERRYRDFVDLYRQLKKILVSQMGLSLPASWGKVDMESRKFIGNTSPDVIEVRSVLLQVCLQSLLEAGPPLSTAPPLLRFLSLPSSSCQPFDSVPNTHAAKSPNEYGQNQLQLKELNLSLARPALEPGRSKAEVGEHDVAKFSVFGKTIRLIVKMHPVKPLKQQLAVQHNACAGCYGQLDSATGFVSGIATTLGLGGPRLCDYSGQLFCMKCHLNETAVIPARVLQMWDFTPRRVSQLAKAYLDSIYDQVLLYLH